MLSQTLHFFGSFADPTKSALPNFIIAIMYGGPISEEQKASQEQYVSNTLRTAAALAGALWIAPFVIHFAKKQFE